MQIVTSFLRKIFILCQFVKVSPSKVSHYTVGFRPLQEMEVKLRGGQTVHSGPLLRDYGMYFTYS